MKYKRLGNAGMKVSAISLGGWINYGEGKVASDTARNIVTSAYEHGINYYDLADIYGKGGAEEQMGKLLSQFPRHTLVIATKLFWPMSDDVNDQGLSRKHIMESVEKSLKRLGTDYIDIYFCHRYDSNTPVLETVRAMNDLVQQGKILYWGTSEWEANQIQEAINICQKYGYYEPKAEQPQYSMLWRDRVENQVLPVTKNNGIGLVVWSPLAMGMLTGKYDDGIGEDTRFGKEPWAKERYLNDTNAAKVRQLKPIADDLGITRAQLALAWTIRDDGVSSAITGATRPSQLIDNAQAASIDLTDEMINKIEQILQ